MKKIIMITFALLGALATQNTRTSDEERLMKHIQHGAIIDALSGRRFQLKLGTFDFIKDHILTMPETLKALLFGSSEFNQVNIDFKEWNELVNSMSSENKKRLSQIPLMQTMFKHAQRLGYMALGSSIIGFAGIAGTAYLAHQDWTREQPSTESRWKRIAGYGLVLGAGVLGIASTITAIANRNSLNEMLKPLR